MTKPIFIPPTYTWNNILQNDKWKSVTCRKHAVFQSHTENNLYALTLVSKHNKEPSK